MRVFLLLVVVAIASACTREQVYRAYKEEVCSKQDLGPCEAERTFDSDCCLTCLFGSTCTKPEVACVDVVELDGSGCPTCYRTKAEECNRDIPECTGEITFDKDTKCPLCYKPKDEDSVCVLSLCNDIPVCQASEVPEKDPEGCCPSCQLPKCTREDSLDCKTAMSEEDFPICESKKPEFNRETCCYDCKPEERPSCDDVVCIQGGPICGAGEKPYVKGSCCPICIPEETTCEFKRVLDTCNLKDLPDCEADTLPEVVDCCPLCKPIRVEDEFACDCGEKKVCVRKKGEGICVPKRKVALCIMLSDELTENLAQDDVSGEGLEKIVKHLIDSSVKKYCFEDHEATAEVSKEDCFDMAEKLGEASYEYSGDEICGKKFFIETVTKEDLKDIVKEENEHDHDHDHDHELHSTGFRLQNEEDFDLLRIVVQNLEGEEGVTVEAEEIELSTANKNVVYSTLLAALFINILN